MYVSEVGFTTNNIFCVCDLFERLSQNTLLFKNKFLLVI